MSRLAVTYLLLQILLPMWQLTQPRPARFGWQMYAGVSQPANFLAVYADGERPIDLSEYLVRTRGDVQTGTVIPPAVCQRHADVLAVRFRVLPEKQPREVRCR